MAFELPFFRRRAGAASAPPGEALAPEEQALRIARAYHLATRHHPGAFARGPGYLDWETQPDPFRRYGGAPLVALEHEPLADSPGYDLALVEGRLAPRRVERRAVARLLEDALGITAWKEHAGTRWALRANPSSGNLHPTEGYVLAGPGVLGEQAFLAHYAPREHALELRRTLPRATWDELRGSLPDDVLFVGLSSIHWREAWKYGERAYRYCQHDVGHALAALAIAAAGLGWRTRLADDLGHAELERLLGTRDARAAEPEEPDLLLVLSPSDFAEDALPRDAPASLESAPLLGTPNALSPEHVDWPALDAVTPAVRKPRNSGAWSASAQARTRLAASLASVPLGTRPCDLRAVLHRRRSAVAFDGRTELAREDFLSLLARTLPTPGRVPFRALPWTPRVHLGLFVHRVRDLPRGLYLLARDPERLPLLRAALDPAFAWSRVPGAHEDLPLRLLREGDLRGSAALVSCEQAIAADGAFAVAMLAEFDLTLGAVGAWAYPRLHWEAGAIGQVLYLEAETLGIRATGIGCFFDEPTQQLFGLSGGAFRTLYHFTVGGPVDDPRLTTLPAYPPPQ